MAEKNESFSKRKERLLDKLEQHPDLMDRIESILDLASEDGSEPVRSADEVESLLVEELRKLGNETLTNWAGNAEEKVSRDYRSKNPSTQQRCKKN